MIISSNVLGLAKLGAVMAGKGTFENRKVNINF